MPFKTYEKNRKFLITVSELPVDGQVAFAPVQVGHTLKVVARDTKSITFEVLDLKLPVDTEKQPEDIW